MTIGAVTEPTPVGEHRAMIRNVVIHASNEQPLMADLFDLPNAEDAGLVCTNVRMMDGKRPVFIDHIDSTFFFPYHVIRFIEIPKGAVPAPGRRRSKGPGLADDVAADAGEAEPESLAPGRGRRTRRHERRRGAGHRHRDRRGLPPARPGHLTGP